MGHPFAAPGLMRRRGDRYPDHPANAAGIALAAFVCAMLLLAGTGCGGSDAPWRRVGGRGDVISSTRPWHPRPTAIRVYPATRFVRERGKPLLELTVELFDDMGDSIKAPGHYGVELYASRDPMSPRPGAFLRGWDVQVMSLEQHESHFDAITRGYLFRLELEEPSAAGDDGDGGDGDGGEGVESEALRVPRASVVRVEFRPAPAGEARGAKEVEPLRTQALIRTGE